MRYTKDELADLLIGRFPYLEDDLAEKIAAKLSTGDVLRLLESCKASRDQYLQHWCKNTINMRTNREKLAEVEKYAKGTP